MIEETAYRTTSISAPEFLPRMSDSCPRLTVAKREKSAYGALKRVVDIVFATLGLLVLSPLMALVSLVIVATDGFPIFFKQSRVGKDGQMFTILKFRSMLKNAEHVLKTDPKLAANFEKNFKLDDDPRITRFGKFLRKSSIDELPQLLNVLRGDMSIVGPRPIVERELERYGEFQDVYTSLIPGCTGLWQCSGRSNTTYEERVTLDVLYAHKASIPFDLKIIAKTFSAVLAKHGAK